MGDIEKQKPLHIILEHIENGCQIITDSRQIQPGDIFLALKGDNFDGNQFAPDAINHGCRIAIVDDPKYSADNKYLLVDDTLTFLQKASKEYRKTFNIPFIGITGSNGKTTTKELTQAVLSKKYASQATRGNLNNHIGVPLTLLSLKRKTELAIIEMGANHVGEIDTLSHLAMPTHAIITNIGKAHLEGFGNIENIEKAKSELFDYVVNRNGTLFVNCDDPRLKKHASHKNAITYGINNENHCSGQITASYPFVEVSFRVNKNFGKAIKGTEGHVKSHLTGSYNFNNIMAAITAGLFFGVPEKAIAKAIEDYKPTNNRSQVIHTKNNTIVMDAYNANPTSMAAALENFGLFHSAPKAVLLGDMLELGKDAEKEHKTIVEMVKQGGFQLQVFVGEHFSEVQQNYHQAFVFKNVDDAARWLAENPLHGYHILIKGSRGIKMEKLLNLL